MLHECLHVCAGFPRHHGATGSWSYVAICWTIVSLSRCLSTRLSLSPPSPLLILFSYSPVRIASHPSSSVSPLFYLWLCTERWTPVIWRWCKVTCNLRHKIYTSKWCKPRARILHFLPVVHQLHCFFFLFTQQTFAWNVLSTIPYYIVWW